MKFDDHAGGNSVHFGKNKTQERKKKKKRVHLPTCYKHMSTLFRYMRNKMQKNNCRENLLLR